MTWQLCSTLLIVSLYCSIPPSLCVLNDASLFAFWITLTFTVWVYICVFVAYVFILLWLTLCRSCKTDCWKWSDQLAHSVWVSKELILQLFGFQRKINKTGSKWRVAYVEEDHFMAQYASVCWIICNAGILGCVWSRLPVGSPTVLLQLLNRRGEKRGDLTTEASTHSSRTGSWNTVHLFVYSYDHTTKNKWEYFTLHCSMHATWITTSN